MSRVGKCIDNGPMEGFWGILKCEMYYLRTSKLTKNLGKPLNNSFTTTIMSAASTG